MTLSLGFILIFVVFGGKQSPEFMIQAEKNRKQKKRKWYQTLWDFAWGTYFLDLYKAKMQIEKSKITMHSS